MIHMPQPLNIFILKNLDSMSNKMLFGVLRSKFGMGYLKFLKKDRKKLLKDHALKKMLLDILQTDGYNDCENEKVILLSLIFILLYF